MIVRRRFVGHVRCPLKISGHQISDSHTRGKMGSPDAYADTVEKLTNHARFTFLEDDSYCSFRVIGSVVTANYGWRLNK
jgi:formylmethanofuran dehydrogenase subunit B